jgi:pimeloyl-ACP methyl ester carboxylesterase
MDILMIDKAIICGLSMGGYIALNAIQRYSNRFAGLILCDTQCSADTTEGKEKRYTSIKDIESNGTSGFMDGMIKNLFAESTYSNNNALVEEVRSLMLTSSAESVTKTLKALAERWETCSSLQEVTVPTLIICGKEDKITPPEKAEYMNQHIKGSELAIIEKAGHLSTLEQPAEVNSRINRFIVSINK